jgi:hypothetical protein
MEHAGIEVLRGCTMGHTGDVCLPSDLSAARFVKTMSTVVSWMAGLPRASVGTAKHGHGLPVEEAPHDEVKDAIRAQCALETLLGHREVRENT